MVSPLSDKFPRWEAGLIINVLALSLASYLTLVYYYVPTRRLLAEYVRIHGASAVLPLHGIS